MRSTRDWVLSLTAGLLLAIGGSAAERQQADRTDAAASSEAVASVDQLSSDQEHTGDSVRGTDEAWPQLKFDSRHSGDASDRVVQTPLGLVAAIPLSDSMHTAPVIADDHLYAIDASGVAYGIDLRTKEVTWRYESKGGRANCNNVSSPAIAGDYLHFGTMSGFYYVLDRRDGSVVREIACESPIFGSPVVSSGRVYFVTLGSHVHALEPDGTICWEWDYVREQLGFAGPRFDGAEWLKQKGNRVNTNDQFCCAWNPAAIGRVLVIPAGGAVVWLEDAGDRPHVRAVHLARTPTLGLSIGADGTVYRQWHRLDNGGRVDTLQLVDGEVKVGFVPGTQTSTRGGLLSFCSVSLRGDDVYRCRPEEGFGLCRHRADLPDPQCVSKHPSIAAPVLVKDHAIYGALDGTLQVVPLANGSPAWSFSTAFGKAISAPVAVSAGRVCFGCDDGYLYILGPDGTAPLPKEDRKLWQVRSPLPAERQDSAEDWFTSFGNWGNTNVTRQSVQPPFRLKWIRRFEGTTKHSSTCGGGRMYTHTAEGQIFAVEQETGRLLWRRYFPGVHICYTSPLYYEERILVPQAGLERCRLRCLDAATGDLLWEAPFSGSPSWNRQIPPVIHENLAIYSFSTGQYEADRWLVGHGDIPNFPADQKPLVRAFDLKTGAEVWTADFSQYGTGGDDAGLCLMDGTIYYSCFLGFKRDNGAPRATGVTAAIEPSTGDILWTTTKHAVHSGCTISAADGRLYLGGYSPVDEQANRVWCLDAKDGSLIWQSDPIDRAIHVISIGDQFLFTHAQYENGYLIDKQSGNVLRTLTEGYKCTRFTFCEPYLFGANLDVYDLSDPKKIVPLSTGPALDPSQCVGAFVSNGRLYYTSHGSGLQVSGVCGLEAQSNAAAWILHSREDKQQALPR